MAIKTIIKRDGQVVPHDRGRIVNAISKAAASIGGFGFKEAELMENGYMKTARAYIIYRHQSTGYWSRATGCS